MNTAYDQIIDIDHIASFESKEHMTDIIALAEAENSKQRTKIKKGLYCWLSMYSTILWRVSVVLRFGDPKVM